MRGNHVREDMGDVHPVHRDLAVRLIDIVRCADTRSDSESAVSRRGVRRVIEVFSL